MWFLDHWRTERQRQRKADQYVAALLREPDPADVAWLASAAARGDEDHARWELRYANRAIGVLVAQRDALDDRTGSLIAQALTAAFERDQHIDRSRFALVERQFNARVSAYRDALATPAADSATRLGQTLLAFSGGSFRDVDDTVRRAGDLLAAMERSANETLRSVFGDVALPEHIPPSAVAGGASN